MTDDLIAAWVAWERSPSSQVAVNRKLAAIETAGLDPRNTHDAIAACRRAGMSIPDAVQSMVNRERMVA